MALLTRNVNWKPTAIMTPGTEDIAGFTGKPWHALE